MENIQISKSLKDVMKKSIVSLINLFMTFPSYQSQNNLPRTSLGLDLHLCCDGELSQAPEDKSIICEDAFMFIIFSSD